MAASEALQTTNGGEGVSTPKPRIDPLTRLLVLRLKEAEPERSSASIALVAGISEASVRRLLAVQTTDAKALQKSMMQLTAPDRLENWERACEVAAEKGYHQPTKDYLEAAGLIDAKPGVQANVNIAPTVTLVTPFRIGGAPEPKPETPVIDVTPMTPGVD